MATREPPLGGGEPHGRPHQGNPTTGTSAGHRDPVREANADRDIHRARTHSLAAGTTHHTPATVPYTGPERRSSTGVPYTGPERRGNNPNQQRDSKGRFTEGRRR